MTDYSSSSEDSDTTDEDDDEEVDQGAGEESTSGPEDSRAVYVHRLNFIAMFIWTLDQTVYQLFICSPAVPPG